MEPGDQLAERFHTHRPRLRAAAYRLLGSLSDADDAVQEAWLRVNRSGTDGVDNLGGWLTTVVAREVAEQALFFSRRAPFARPVLVNGAAGAVAAVNGRVYAVLAFTVRHGKIAEIDILADADRLRGLD